MTLSDKRIAELREIYSVSEYHSGHSIVEIDLVEIVGEDPWKTAEDYGKTFNLSVSEVTPNGPGGGNPLVRFVGTTDNIYRMLDDYDDPDASDEYPNPTQREDFLDNYKESNDQKEETE